jgi:alkyl sulfatase BDS1-like metallo-beta-lactamase superfamily hydrolase
MKNLFSIVALITVGFILGLLASNNTSVRPVISAIDAAKSSAMQSAARLAAGRSSRVDARASLFIEFPDLYPAIKRGGAFGGSWSNAIAQDIFAASDEGIADARALGRIEEIAPRTWMIFLPLVNVVVFETDDGLVVVDAGTAAEGPAIAELIASVSKAPIHTIIYTHGHSDHAFGTWALLADDPLIIGTDALVARFDRYRRLRGSVARYLGQPVDSMPKEKADMVYPTQTFAGELVHTVGGETFHLRAHRGETDDQLYVWVPSRKAIATADYYQGFLPNAGNGKRVQRHPEEWAYALREMASAQPELLLPAHGNPITTPELIQENLGVLAEVLELISVQTIAELNKGTRKDLIPTRLSIPDALRNHPTLEEKYVSMEDVSRMVIKLYTGWWDDIPSHWSPATFDAQSREIVRLAGGVEPIINRARGLISQDIVMASHLTDWAWFAYPNDHDVQQLVIDTYYARIIHPDSNTQEMLTYLDLMAAARAKQLER